MNMKKRRNTSAAKPPLLKNRPVPVEGHVSSFPHGVSVPNAPGVSAVMERARSPYEKRPLSEDEALNLICDARKNEPVLPLGKLLKKYKHELAE